MFVRFFVAGVAFFFTASGAAFTTLAQEFYKGKTINFIVGASPGGGFDTYTRAIARHIGKHIPWNPSTLVQNMPGAGGLVAANHMYHNSKPDGLTVGIWAGSFVLGQRMGQKGIEFDGKHFEWMGAPVRDSPVCALSRASGITSIEEWFAAKKPVKVGGTGPGSTPSIPPRILRAALGLPIQLIDGFKGTSEIKLAAEGKEVDGGCWNWESIKVMWKRGLDSGEVNIILQVNPKRHPDLSDVPNAVELAKTDHARQLIKAGVHDQSSVFRAYSISPRTPTDRVRILQKAFLDTLKDSEFLAEANKAQLDINPISGEQIKEIVADIFKLDDKVVADLKKVLLE